MRKRRHPLSGAVYDVRPDGLVEVYQETKLRHHHALLERWLDL